jgi:hypothetical protein
VLLIQRHCHGTDRIHSAVGNGGFAGGINWLDMVSHYILITLQLF